MRPLTAYADCGDDRWDGGGGYVRETLFGIPMVLSRTARSKSRSSTRRNILYSDTGGFDVDISTQAAIEIDSVPTDPPVAATVIESLCPSNLFGVRVTRWLAYLRAQTGSVVYMTVSY